jgi:cytochrome c553
MKPGKITGVAILAILTVSVAHAGVVDDLMKEYQAQGASAASDKRGHDMWFKEYKDTKSGKMRSCTSCHTDDLKKKGKHVKTGKVIDPLAPSMNSERLTELKKIKKWFKRNCKWTVGRECTAQEKSDFLSYIRKQ